MVTRRQRKAYAREIARQSKPRRIVLFGSYASGQPTPDSDVDLLAIMPDGGRARDKAVEIRPKAPSPFAMDLLVRSPRTIRERLAPGDWFIADILSKGGE